MSKSEWIPTLCYQCKSECAIIARVEDGMLKEVRGNPHVHGKACVKAMSGVSLEYSPDRLTHPLKRVGERGEGKFERISWDEALDIMTRKLQELKDRGESHKLTASFFPHSLTDPKWRFLHAYGGFLITALPHCDSAKIVAWIKSTGGVPVHHIPPAWFTVPKDGIMMLLGRTAFGCLEDAVIPKHILDAKDRGAKLVVIDPFFTPDAAKAHWWIPIRPGGDAALLVGMTHHIVTNGLYSKEFVADWIREGDFDKLKDYLVDKTPERMSEICDISPEDIRKLAEMCAKAPSVGIDSFKGAMLGNALDVCHAWCIFLAVTGNIDNPGGQPLPDLVPLKPVEPAPAPPDLHQLGYHRTGPDRDQFEKYSFIMEPTWYAAQAIRNDSLKMHVVTEANPALTVMGDLSWRDAVRMKDPDGNYKLELLVSFEIMMSETAKHADLVLPDKSFFERWELVYMPWWYNYGHGVAIRQPVVEPPGECRSANDVFIELGKRVAPEYFQFDSLIDYYDIELSGIGLSIQKLKEMGGHWSSGTMGFRKYEERGGFGTPSKKVHLYWEDLEETVHGNQAFPRVEPPAEYRQKVEDYPFILVSYRTIFHGGSGQWTFNNPQLRDGRSGFSKNPLLMNPSAARKLGIGDGDTVTVESATGKVQVDVCLTERIRPDCLCLGHGFGSSVGNVATACAGVSDNDLIPDAGMTLDYQDLVGAEAHVSTRVRIVR